MGVPKSIYIEAFCWPTEDINKVIEALSLLYDSKFSMSRVRGQFGEKIVVLRARITNPSQVKEVYRRLRPVLGEIKESAMVMINKQKLLEGRIVRGKGVKVKVNI